MKTAALPALCHQYISGQANRLMVSEWSEPHTYSALRFGLLRPAAPHRGRARRQIRAGEEMSGARTSTLGAAACLTSGHRVEFWDMFYRMLHMWT